MFINKASSVSHETIAHILQHSNIKFKGIGYEKPESNKKFQKEFIPCQWNEWEWFVGGLGQLDHITNTP